MANPLADAASSLEATIEDWRIGGRVDVASAWNSAGAVSALHAQADPDLAYYVAGLLNFAGAWQEADKLLDWVTGDLPPGAEARVRVENVRALLAAARGDFERAVAIWVDALHSSDDADIPLQNKLRINLALASLRTGNPHRARACIADVVAAASPADARAAVLVASTNLAVTTLLNGSFPHVEDLDQLDRATWDLTSDDRFLPAARLEAAAQLASIYFDVTASTGQWEEAEHAVDVLETAAQSLSASLGADDPAALSVRMLLASAEVRLALAEHYDNRVRHAVGVLHGIVRCCDRVFGPTHLLTMKAEVELATAVYAVCAEGQSLAELQEAIGTAAKVAQLASDVLGAQHALAIRAAACLHDCRLLAAELIGLNAYLLPTARPHAVTAPPELAIAALSADEDCIRIRLSWSDDRVGVMRIRQSTHPPSWQPGTMIPTATIDGYGQELHGNWSETPNGFALEAELPRDHRICVPFIVEDGWAVTGYATQIGLPPLANDLYARRIGNQVTASWVWPSDVRQAEIFWSTPEYGVVRKRITATQYRDGSGRTLTIGPGGGTLTVRMVEPGVDGPIMSDPVSVQVEGLRGRISYRFIRPRGVVALRSRRRVLLVSADVDCVGLTLVVEMTHDIATPRQEGSDLVLCRITDVALHRGETRRFGFELPADWRQRYWLRCFVESRHVLTVVSHPAVDLRMP